MARSINTIHQSILTDLRARPELAGLSSTSVSALYVLIAYVVAVAIASLESLFDLAGVELREKLAELKPHTLRYYQTRALAFRLGVDLLPGSTDYAPELDADTLAQQRIIRYASVTEAGATLQIKVAKEHILPLDAAELAAFEDYIYEVKDAGVRVEVISQPADRLQLTMDVYYNPQILDGRGRRLDGTDDLVVYNAVVAYTEALRFDGLFVNADLVDRLQATEGIQIPALKRVEIASDGDPTYVGVNVTYEPVSGFVRLYDPAALTLNYIPYADA